LVTPLPKRPVKIDPWFSIGLNAWSLGIEASWVMTLRMLKIANGGAQAQVESQRMIQEKVQSASELSALLTSSNMTPACAATKTIEYYQTKVRANRRRLMKR
jgi:hypothetical protein